MANLCHSQKRSYYELFGETINSATDVALRPSRVHIRILEQYAKALNVNVELTKRCRYLSKSICALCVMHNNFRNLAWLNVNVGVAQVVTA